MSRLFAALLFLSLSVPAFAQDVFPPRQTTAPQDARFEVLSSSNGSGLTFRLDRWTGQVHQLDARHPAPSWHLCEFQDGAPDASTWNTPRFQLLTTGLFSSEVLLVDTLTSRTWIRTLGDEITPGRRDHRTVWVPLK